MTHPIGWTTDEPCPSCGSWDITEYEIRIGTSSIHMGWECRDCGHVATWDLEIGDQPGRAASRQLLSVMPLHAITTLYGEKGLRERFALEVARFADVADRRLTKRALQLAARLHATDSRQREPYVNHLLRVALRVICYYGIRDADVVSAALLHDTVEDHADCLAATGQDGTLTVLAAMFGSRVARLVAAVTNPVCQPGHDEHALYREHVAVSLAACPWARVIKVSDFTDNGVGLIHTTGRKAVELADKYAPLVPVLRDLITRSDTPLADEVKAHILGQLDRAEERFAAIRGTTVMSPDDEGR